MRTQKSALPEGLNKSSVKTKLMLLKDIPRQEAKVSFFALLWDGVRSVFKTKKDFDLETWQRLEQRPQKKNDNYEGPHSGRRF